MSKKNAPAPQKETARLEAFSVREYEAAGEQRRDWTKIGAAFEHGDGKGWNIVLHCLPIDGKVVLRLPEPREPAA